MHTVTQWLRQALVSCRRCCLSHSASSVLQCGCHNTCTNCPHRVQPRIWQHGGSLAVAISMTLTWASHFKCSGMHGAAQVVRQCKSKPTTSRNSFQQPHELHSLAVACPVAPSKTITQASHFRRMLRLAWCTTKDLLCKPNCTSYAVVAPSRSHLFLDLAARNSASSVIQRGRPVTLIAHACIVQHSPAKKTSCTSYTVAAPNRSHFLALAAACRTARLLSSTAGDQSLQLLRHALCSTVLL